MIPLGRMKAKIESHFIGANENGNLYVGLRVRPNGETETGVVKIWMTSKALNRAGRALKLCGFDIAQTPLEELEQNPRLLLGREVEIDVSEQEFNGRVYTRFDLVVPEPTVDKAKLASLTQGIRDAMTEGDKPKAAAPKNPAAPKAPNPAKPQANGGSSATGGAKAAPAQGYPAEVPEDADIPF